MWEVSNKCSGGYWALFHKYIAQSFKFIYMYMDRSAINITALVTVSVDNMTVCLSFIVYLNSQRPGIVYIKISI